MLLGLPVGGLMVSTGVIKAHDLEPFLDAVPVVSVGRVEEHPGIYGEIGLATLRIPVHVVAARGTTVMAELLKNRSSTTIQHERFAGVFVPGRSLATPRTVN